MPAPFTHKKLTDVKDSAEEFGLGDAMEARFARPRRRPDLPEVTRALEAGDDGIEVIAFGPRYDGDGEVVPGWWSD